jgi:hypothetical protein
VPSDFSASMCSAPAASWTIPPPTAIVFTGRVAAELVSRTPSWPLSSLPQLQIEPLGAHGYLDRNRTVSRTAVAELAVMAMAPGERDAVRAQRQAELEPVARCGCTRPLDSVERHNH